MIDQSRITRGLCAAAVTLAMANAPVGAEELFGPGGVLHPTGPGTPVMVVGDIDVNGFPDVVASDAGGRITVKLADGVGGFVELPPPAVPPQAAAMILPDLDRDGRPDLVVARVIFPAEVELHVYRGNGRGSFFPLGVWPLGTFQDYPLGLPMVSGDFDGDGAADVAVARWQDSVVIILLGDGQGGFASSTIESVATGPLDLVVGDLDRDGIDDLVTINNDAQYSCGVATMTFLLTAGSAPDRVRTDVAGPYCARAAVIADFDSDALPDLLVGSKWDATPAGGPGSLFMFHGAGDGTFVPVSEIPQAGYIESLAVGNLDRGAAMDVVAVTAISTQIWTGDGQGGLARRPENGPDRGASPAFGDLDGDGTQDLLLADNGGVAVLRGDGLGGLRAAQGLPVSPGAFYFLNTAIADFNLDSIPDIAIAATGYPAYGVDVLIGDGRRGFEAPLRTSSQYYEGASGGPSVLAIGEFDGDRIPDMVMVGADRLEVFGGQGNGEFVPLATLPVPCAEHVTVSDLDKDGNADLVVAAGHAGNWYDGGEPPPVECRRITAWLGDGRGGFEATPALEVPFVPVALVAHDLGGDGNIDLAVSARDWNSAAGAVYVFAGDGAGGFVQSAEIPVLLGQALAGGDVDTDGDIDLVVGGSFDGLVLLRNESGFGFFKEQLGWSIGATAAVLRDVNSDNVLDLLTSSVSGMVILAGDGTGGFRRVITLSGGTYYGPSLADFDQDGMPDLVGVDPNLGPRVWFNQLRDRADVNGSNRIDAFDLAAVSRLAGARAETCEIDPECEYRRSADVDLNGIVDGDDLALLTSRFAQLRQVGSPLRPALADATASAPSSVVLRESAREGDLLTVELLVDGGGQAASGADFTVTFQPNASDTQIGQVLEVAGFEPGTFLSGAGQLYSIDTSTPGTARIQASRLPNADQSVGGSAPLLSLKLRARREGEAVLDFAPNGRANPALVTASAQEVPGINFIGGSSVEVTTSSEGDPGRRIGAGPAPLDVGTTAPGITRRSMLRVSNFGFSELRVTDVNSTLAEFSSYFNAAFSVPPFGFVELPVTFEPTQQGFYSGELTIQSDDLRTPEFRAPIVGRTDDDLLVLPQRLEFAAVPPGGESVLKLKLSNRGVESFVFQGFQSSDQAFLVEPGFTRIDPGGTGEVVVRFRPGAVGPVHGSLELNLGGGGSRAVVIALHGTGATP